MKWLAYLEKWDYRVTLTVTIVLMAVVTALDWVTNPDISFSIFYVLPVSIAAWFVGRRAGLLLSLLSAGGWHLADALSNPHIYSSPLIPYWDALVRLSFFVIVTYAITSLRAAQLMQEELSEFIVHDLRSPLTSIGAALKSCQTATPEENHHQRRLLVLGIDAIERMAMMINSLLDVARLEASRMPVETTPVNPAHLVEVAVGQIASWAHELNKAIQPDIAEGLPQVMADQNLTVRVLENLLSNAIKYTPTSGQVEVAVAAQGGNQVVFSVTDHGPGVPAHLVGGVFDKFTQVRARQAGAAVGSGLGLTFCRRAVEAQGGHIKLESQPDVATTVSFSLPVVADESSH